MPDHQCPYPAAGCTADDCHITARRHDERFVEALVRVDHDNRINCTGPGEVGCVGRTGWHSWTNHRRHVAESQLTELRRIGLIPEETQP